MHLTFDCKNPFLCLYNLLNIYLQSFTKYVIFWVEILKNEPNLDVSILDILLVQKNDVFSLKLLFV